MHMGFDLDRVLDAMRNAKEMADLEAIMVEITGELGFEQFALGHHVDLLRPPSNAVRLTNYHADWIEHSLDQRFFAEDPVHAASMRMVRPFRWDEIPLFHKMSDPQHAIIEHARKYGLVEGFTIPVHQPGEYNGTCSFSARSFGHLHPHSFALAQMAATFAFECARRLMRQTDGKAPEPVPHLTERQRESLILVGRGKTDAEIAALMQISKATAHEHVEAGRRAYGNAQRTYMVLRALYDGVITFADVFRR
jgi:LuxR family transcriptional regulator, quorum-sensing system regulator CciR